MTRRFAKSSRAAAAKSSNNFAASKRARGWTRISVIVAIELSQLDFDDSRVRNSTRMTVAVLFPRYDHPAIEERYASWQSELLLRGERAHFYDDDEPVKKIVEGIDTEFVLIITDPLLLPPPNLGERLAAKIGDAFAVLPVSNEAEHLQQRVAAPATYMTLREEQIAAASLASSTNDVEQVTWDSSDPGAFVCRTTSLASINDCARNVLKGRDVMISRGDYVHRWSSMRGQARLDLLERISPD